MPDLLSVLHATSPLANRMRPTSLASFLGSAVSKRQDLAKLFASEFMGNLPSLILVGPPGSGKTSLAKLLAGQSGRPLHELSAVTSGVKDVREVLETAEKHQSAYGIQSILFIDEIHRFSKSQQDSLLAAIERGTICLLAATTENPSISLNPALISRTQVLQLDPLNRAELHLLVRAAIDSDAGLAGFVSASEEILDSIVASALGDARACLGILEAAALDVLTVAVSDPNASVSAAGPVPLTQDAVKRSAEAVRRKYDSSGDSHYDSISAYIKSMRGSDADAAVYWLARMLDGGEDPRFIARRLMIFASEDIGLADNQALLLANAAVTAANQLGMPEVRIPLAHVTVYLSLAPKSNSAYRAINEALKLVTNGTSTVVPEHLRNLESLDPEVRTRVEKYVYPHDFKPPIVKQAYLPEPLADVRLYEPKESGAEASLIEINERIRRALGK